MLTDDLGAALSEAVSNADQEILKEMPLCDPCLGRLFGKVGTGTDNVTRGLALRKILNSSAPENNSDCQMCRGLTSKMDDLAEIAMESMNEWEFSTFLIGTKFDQELMATEEAIWVEVGVTDYEPMKAEFNREIGKRVERNTGKLAEFSRPDIVAIVDTMYESVNVQVSPIYIYGRYQKFSRELPQTRWPCRVCHGKGCQRCSGTGKMYQSSVEELMGGVALTLTKGKDHRFHGMGREDIDALMLGRGRPFVLEIKEPRVRVIDLPELETKINDSTKEITVTEMRWSESSEVVGLKGARPYKKYKVQVQFDAPVSEEKINEVVSCLGGNSIAQRTPIRVSHRRADRKRTRMIKEMNIESLSPTETVFTVTAEAGTYIKELVHGDEGRTVPSVAGELGVECTVTKLDVLEILDEE
jgi:tRNA pseudouridine synthase 10